MSKSIQNLTSSKLNSCLSPTPSFPHCFPSWRMTTIYSVVQVWHLVSFLSLPGVRSLSSIFWACSVWPLLTLSSYCSSNHHDHFAQTTQIAPDLQMTSIPVSLHLTEHPEKWSIRTSLQAFLLHAEENTNFLAKPKACISSSFCSHFFFNSHFFLPGLSVLVS